MNEKAFLRKVKTILGILTISISHATDESDQVSSALAAAAPAPIQIETPRSTTEISELVEKFFEKRNTKIPPGGRAKAFLAMRFLQQNPSFPQDKAQLVLKQFGRLSLDQLTHANAILKGATSKFDLGLLINEISRTEPEQLKKAAYFITPEMNSSHKTQLIDTVKWASDTQIERSSKFIREHPPSFVLTVETILTMETVTENEMFAARSILPENASGFEKLRAYKAFRDATEKHLENASYFFTEDMPLLEKCLFIEALKVMSQQRFEAIKERVLKRGSSIQQLFMLKAAAYALEDITPNFLRAEFESTADQFSGALFAAHSRGIKGGGVQVYVIEKSPATPHIGLKAKGTIFRRDAYSKEESSSFGSANHAMHVAGIVQQISPKSHLALGVEPSFDALSPAQVINVSLGARKEGGEVGGESVSSIIKTLGTALQSSPQAILCKAMGNDGKLAQDSEEHVELNKRHDILERSIFVVNVAQTNVVAKVGIFPKGERLISNVPGSLKGVRENTLSTKGTEVISFTKDADGKEIYEKATGSSMASPTVAGAAALVTSHYAKMLGKTPDKLSPKEMLHVKEALLTTADRNFFANDAAFAARTSGYNSTFVYDDIYKLKWLQARDHEAPEKVSDEEFEESFSKESSRDLGNGKVIEVKARKFDPSIYGRGMLNLRDALLYVELRAQGNLEIFDQVKERIERKAAEKIQSTWLKRLRP